MNRQENAGTFQRSNVPTLWRWAIYVVLMAGLAAFTFGNLRHHRFAYDDEDYVRNAALAQQSPSHLIAPSFDKPWASRFGVHAAFYLLYKLFGTAPAGYHTVNVGLHLVNALLLARLAGRLARATEAGFLTGYLFLLNGAGYRAVCWISAISFLLGTGFVLLALLLFREHLQRGGSARLVGSLLCYGGAMAVHQAMGIALLPLALLLLEDRRDVRFVLSRVAPFACLSAVFLAIQRLGYRNPFVGEEAYAFGGHILVNFAKYLFGLATDAHTSAFRHISFGAVITAPGAALVTAVLVLAMLRGGKTARFWAIWTLVAIVPFALWRRDYVLSRYFYLPAAGASALLGLLIHRLMLRGGGRSWRPALAVVVLIAIGISSVLSLKKLEALQHWDSGKYHLLERRDYATAASELQRSLARDPDQPSEVRFALALAYFHLARGREAETVLRELLARDDRYAKAHLYLGEFYWSEGEIGPARAEVERALRLDPDDDAARRLLDVIIRAQAR